MSLLESCPSCHRHVYAAEVACPFCGAPRAEEGIDGTAPRPRAGLLAAAAVGVALATGVVACGSDVAPLYGIPAIEDGGTRTSTDAGS